MVSALAERDIEDQPEQEDYAARVAACPRCGSEVIAAPILGSHLDVLLERGEVQPLEPCPTCLSKRQLKYDCWRCGNTRVIGEDLSGMMAVALDDDGLARLLPHGADRRARGESIHRAHRCC